MAYRFNYVTHYQNDHDMIQVEKQYTGVGSLTDRESLYFSCSRIRIEPNCNI